MIHEINVIVLHYNYVLNYVSLVDFTNLDSIYWQYIEKTLSINKVLIS
jgi:hypothetical protein